MNPRPERVAGTGQRQPTEVRLAGRALLLAPLLLLTGGASLPVHRARPVS